MTYLRSRGVQILILGFVTLALFGQTLFFPFLHWDDYIHIVRNPLVTAGSWLSFWVESHINLYIPFSYSAWSLLCAVKSPCDPVVFHMMNLILHALNAALVLSLARHYLKDERRAFIVALIFTVHPLQVETVAWISGGRDLWAAFFALGAWRLWLYDKTKGVVPTALFTLSLLSKPSFVALPLALLLIDRRSWARTSLLFVPSVAMGLTTFLSHNLSAMKTTTPLWLRPWMALDAVGFYIAKVLWPWPLVPDYGRSAAEWVNSPPLVYAIFGLIFVGVALWAYRKNPWALASLLFVAPVLGLIPYRFQDVSIVADHYFYLSMATLALAAVSALNAMLAFVPVIAVWSVLSFVQSTAWRDTDTLGAHVLRHNPRSFSFHNALADAAALRGNYPLALEHFGKSIQINPTMIETQLGIPPVLFLSGQRVAAIEAYLAIEKTNGLPPEAERNLIAMLKAEGRHAEADARVNELSRRDRDN